MRSVSLAVSPAVSLTESEIGVTVAVAPTRAVARVHACMHMLMRVVIYMKTLLKRAPLLANESVVAAPGAAPARRRPARVARGALALWKFSGLRGALGRPACRGSRLRQTAFTAP